MATELKYKPLVEAILEIRWKLQELPQKTFTDPNYKILLGRLFDRLQLDYPEYEQLPSANVPDELVPFSVQHRFRVSKKSWPLVQVGPGILTVNSTSDYKWNDFRPRVINAINTFFNAYPKPDDLVISNLLLRYIDAVEVDYIENDAFSFLKDKLKVNISLPDDLFSSIGNVKKKPVSFSFESTYSSEIPPGRITIRFSTGQKNSTSALIWETTMQSAGIDLPAMPNGFENWFISAHDLADDWFFKLIDGELKRRFSGE